MEIRHLTEDDVLPAAVAFVHSLGGKAPTEVERFVRYWDVPRCLGGFDDDGALLGVAATFPSRFTAVGGASLRCYTVPSVGVRPDRQRMGVGRALLEAQVKQAAASGAAVMALNASETGIYGRFGYGPTSSWWSVEMTTRGLRFRDDAPQAAPGSVTELTPAEVAELLPALHERCVGGWGGELARPPGMWWAHLHPRAGKDLPIFAMLRDEAGEPVATVAFTIEQAFDDVSFANVIEVVDIFAVDVRSEAMLARWLCERPLVGTVKAERWNPRGVFGLFLEDGRTMRTTVSSDGVWVRVLDVAAAVEARTTMATGAVRVGLEDRLVPGNARVWQIEGADGALRCQPTDEAPQIAMDIQHLAPLLWGFRRASALAAAGLIEASDGEALATLDALLAVDAPSWCSVGF